MFKFDQPIKKLMMLNIGYHMKSNTLCQNSTLVGLGNTRISTDYAKDLNELNDFICRPYYDSSILIYLKECQVSQSFTIQHTVHGI